MTFKGTCNTRRFNQWFEKRLLPCLKPQTVIVLDNATFHKSKRTRELAEAAGCILLFLPPYSPDLNPIEQKWGNMKNFRKYNPKTSIRKLINMYKCI